MFYIGIQLRKWTNWKSNSSIVWIQLSLLTGESYRWTFKIFKLLSPYQLKSG